MRTVSFREGIYTKKPFLFFGFGHVLQSFTSWNSVASSLFECYSWAFLVTLVQVFLRRNTVLVELKPPLAVNPKEDIRRTSTYRSKAIFFHHPWQPSHKFKKNKIKNFSLAILLVTFLGIVILHREIKGRKMWPSKKSGIVHWVRAVHNVEDDQISTGCHYTTPTETMHFWGASFLKSP